MHFVSNCILVLFSEQESLGFKVFCFSTHSLTTHWWLMTVTHRITSYLAMNIRSGEDSINYTVKSCAGAAEQNKTTNTFKVLVRVFGFYTWGHVFRSRQDRSSISPHWPKGISQCISSSSSYAVPAMQVMRGEKALLNTQLKKKLKSPGDKMVRSHLAEACIWSNLLGQSSLE